MRKVVNILLIISALILLGLMGFLSYRFYQKSEEVNQIQGEWERSVDISRDISDKIYEYISWADGNIVDQEFVRTHVGTIELKISMKLTSSGKNLGIFEQRITKESYDNAYKKAYAALEDSMRYLITKRVESAGFDVSDEAKTDQIIAEALDESLNFYMIKMGPKLIEDYEVLNAEIADAGTYQLVEGELIMDGSLKHNKANVARVKDKLYFEEVTENESEEADVYIYQKINSDGADSVIITDIGD